ncbi:hypothetical protein [Streptomyces sp. NPDC057552]|uniref:hypothetical protein n=1 Tax=Streptomyces sp. NPDC057552 TaxID=3350537 RepID=UPI0036A47CC0
MYDAVDQEVAPVAGEVAGPVLDGRELAAGVQEGSATAEHAVAVAAAERSALRVERPVPVVTVFVVAAEGARRAVLGVKGDDFGVGSLIVIAVRAVCARAVEVHPRSLS